jgi:hypothetical protein
MRQFKLWFCSILLLIANVANSQTSDSTTPDVEELTDGILAFTCEGTDEEFPAIFINDNSKWTMVDDTDFDLITEIDNGFKIQSSKFPDMLAYFQDTGSYWEYNELSEDGPSKTICSEEDELLELVVDAISPKLLENATTLSQTVGKLENKLRKLEDIQDTLNEARETNRKNFIRFNRDKETLVAKYESELSLQTEKLLLLNSRLTKAGNDAGKLLFNILNTDRKAQEEIFNISLNADNKVREQLVEKFDLRNAKLGPYCVNYFLFKPTEIDEECRTGIIQHIFN